MSFNIYQPSDQNEEEVEEGVEEESDQVTS